MAAWIILSFVLGVVVGAAGMLYLAKKHGLEWGGKKHD